jgi:rubrerythrin
MKSKGREEGSPQMNPYAIEWEYDKTKDFSKKYDATLMEDVKLTPAIRKLITGDPPDLTQITKPFNSKAMRASLERACLLPPGVVPWDELFPEDGDAPNEAHRAAKQKSPPESGIATASQSNDDAEETFACDECEKPMGAADSKCPHCGATYDVEGSKPVPPPSPPRKKRSEALKEAAAAKESANVVPIRAQPAKESTDDLDGDAIPF